jgi:hypothetical protein
MVVFLYNSLGGIKMKKRMLTVAALVLCAVFAFAACGGGITKAQVDKAYKDAGYTTAATEAGGNWVVTATKDTSIVVITGYKDKAAADLVVNAYASTVKFERKGNVVAFTALTGTDADNALKIFKDLK